MIDCNLKQNPNVIVTDVIAGFIFSVLCAECSMNVHHKCQKKVANLCGVNQKLMAEALAVIGSQQQVRISADVSTFCQEN